MRLRDLLYPEKVIGFAARVFCGLLALQLGGELLVRFLAAHNLSGLDALLIFPMLAAASIIAYLLRERRGRPARHVPRRGAERRPVLPPDRGEA